MHRSLTFRLTFLFAHASAALLLGLGLLISNLVEHHFDELDRETLAGKLELAKGALARVRARQELNALPGQFETALVGHPGLTLLIFGPDGKLLFSTKGPDFTQQLQGRINARGMAAPVSWTSADGKPHRVVSATAPLGDAGSPPAIVAVDLDVSHHQNFLAGFEKTLWISVIAAAILAGIIGRIAVRRGLAPLRAIKQEASAITAHRLDSRIAADAVPVELKELVEALNTMLGRLEDSFRRLSDFSADLAHELRTPVSNMLMQTQVTLSKPRTAEQYREIMYSNMEEFMRLSRMISDMLFLAKTDHGLVAPSMESVDLAKEVRNLFSYFEVLAEAKNVHLELDGEGKITGDRMLLRRALSNVMSNAIRYTPEQGRVNVVIGHEDDGLRIQIANTGEPIPSEHIPRLFDRFYRVDASRHASPEGAGLGLAMTKSIVNLHGGTIGVQSGQGVTCFEIRLPLEQKDAAVSV